MKTHDQQQPEREKSAPSATPGRVDAQYKVGYGKPPAKSQFRKGKSGNPRGRPKGKLNLSTVLEKVLGETVVINENGQKRSVTKLEVAIKQLQNQAAGGSLPALRELIKLLLIAGGNAGTAPATAAVMDEADQRVLLSILSRFGSATTKQAATDDGQGGGYGTPEVG